MIETYYPRQIGCVMPQPPFVQIGVYSLHYSTGSQFHKVYSDDIAVDLAECYKKRNFEPCHDFLPEYEYQGVTFKFKPLMRVGNDRYNILLLMTNGVKPPKGYKVVLSETEIKRLEEKYLASVAKA